MREGLAGGRQLREGLVLAGSCVNVLLADDCVKVLSSGGRQPFPAASLPLPEDRFHRGPCVSRQRSKSCTRERDSTAGALREKYLPFNRPQLLIRGDSSSFSPTTEQRVRCARVCACAPRTARAAVGRHATSAGHFFTLWPISLS